MTQKEASSQPVRAACYCRISSDPDDKREGTDRQREDTADLCQMKGWQVVDFYVDNDRSASNGKGRPEWERLLADVEAGKIDAVAAWDQDRVNRMMDDFQRYKKLFVQRGILLATSNNGDIDLSTPSGVLTATIKTAVSEHEIAMMKVRMRRAALQRAEQGIPKWKRAFGYLATERGPVPDPDVAPLVRDAYAAVLAGSSLADICRLWNNAGALTQRWVKRTDPDTGQRTVVVERRPWTAPQVSVFLRKPRNAGLRTHNAARGPVTKADIIGPGKWEPLVDEDTFWAAQAVLDAPGRAPGRKTVRRHLLTGVLGCGKCGHYLSGMHTAQKTIAYACKKCSGCSVRAAEVEPLVLGLVAGRLVMADAENLLKTQIHDEEEAERLRTEANRLMIELDQLAVERAEGLLTARQVKISTDVITEKLEAIRRKQQDQERVRVFDGIPLGTPEATDAVLDLSADRLRAVIAVLMEITIEPVGKGNHNFNPERVKVVWK